MTISIVYIDDILIPSSSVEENFETLYKVLLLFKQYSLEMNLKKCLFLQKSIEYLGYIVSASGITLSSRHTDAIKNYPYPTKVVELQRFLGLTNYFRKFIENYALIARPLHNLLRKLTDFFF